MKRVYFLFLLVVLFSLDMARCQTKDYKEKLESLYNHTVPLILSKDLAIELENGLPVVLLDIRSADEYEISHLKGARMIDYDHFEENDVKDIPLDSQIIVYCSVGYRSEKVGEKLLEMGYKDVKNLYGGIFQWKNEGFEVMNKKFMKTDSVHTYNKSWSKWLEKGIKVY
ncbi:MAG: rhodanese-like domain-containing protein [Cyclobacteriaceae bacterium]|nr:rhodanese-like domain-containing protein [Cyclobacteriaceae bacterium]